MTTELADRAATSDVNSSRADPPDAAAAARLAARSAWLIGLLVPAIVLHFAWRLAGATSPWPRWFLARAARACGARVAPSGTALRRDVVFVANHVSWLDILVMGGATTMRFIAQDRIRHWPLIGWLARINATIFVSRTDRVGVAGQIARVRAALTENRSVALYPEGTTTDGRGLLPFKPALFAALDPPPRPLLIQPVVLDFDAAGSALAWIGSEEGVANAVRVLRRRGTFGIGIRFLEPFDPGPVGDRKAVAREVRRRIAAALTAVHGGPIV